MTGYLPPNLLVFFAPRPPLKYVSPLDHLPWDSHCKDYTGISRHLTEFEDPKDTPLPKRGETKEERKVRKRQEKLEANAAKLEERLGQWDPNSDHNATGDAFKTLFVGRLNYSTTKTTLLKEFESYGPVKSVHLVTNSKTGKSKGYAFVEFESERDMHSAYKYADGRKIDDKRVVVDIERGRTIKGWKPRSLGGGLGGTRRGAPNQCIRYSGRVDDSRENGDRDRERDRERDRDRDRERDRDRRGERFERDRYRERERGGYDGYKGRDRGRPHGGERRDRPRDRSRSRERGDNRRRR